MAEGGHRGRDAEPAARREAEADLASQSLAELELAEANLELAYLRERYAKDFKEAFRQALSTLSRRDRTVLRMRFFDGLKYEQIARAYRVNASTVMRWLERQKEVLFKETRRHLAHKLALTSSELDSLLKVLRSEIDVSLSRYLEPGAR